MGPARLWRGHHADAEPVTAPSIHHRRRGRRCGRRCDTSPARGLGSLPTTTISRPGVVQHVQEVARHLLAGCLEPVDGFEGKKDAGLRIGVQDGERGGGEAQHRGGRAWRRALRLRSRATRLSTVVATTASSSTPTTASSSTPTSARSLRTARRYVVAPRSTLVASVASSASLRRRLASISSRSVAARASPEVTATSPSGRVGCRSGGSRVTLGVDPFVGGGSEPTMSGEVFPAVFDPAPQMSPFAGVPRAPPRQWVLLSPGRGRRTTGDGCRRPRWRLPSACGPLRGSAAPI